MCLTNMVVSECQQSTESVSLAIESQLAKIGSKPLSPPCQSQSRRRGPQPVPRRRVSFNASQPEMFFDERSLTQEDRKSLWYEKAELVPSCRESRATILMINRVGGDLNAVDHSLFCVVGLEKYHNIKERELTRRLLIKSVIARQEVNKSIGHSEDVQSLCEISETISKGFKEFAQWQGAMHEVHAYGSSATKLLNKKRDLDDSSMFSLAESPHKRLRSSITGY